MSARRSGMTFAWAVALAACQRAPSEPERRAPPAPTEQLTFALPGEYVTTLLRGEGSESVRAPQGARVSREGDLFRVDAGDEFAIEIVLDAPPSTPSPGAVAMPPDVARVLDEPDLSVFKAAHAGGYSFLVLRQLVPEWDETQRERVLCGSAGGAVSGAFTRADARSFSKAAVQNMVAACRSLELPRLE